MFWDRTRRSLIWDRRTTERELAIHAGLWIVPRNDLPDARHADRTNAPQAPRGRQSSPSDSAHWLRRGPSWTRRRRTGTRSWGHLLVPLAWQDAMELRDDDLRPAVELDSAPERSKRRSRLRPRSDEEQSVSYVELFFDLVYVFAITQLSHYLISHLDGQGAWRTALLLLVVWWAWIYTTWMANWFDPGSLPVCLLLVGGMLASLLMAAALPQAFAGRGALFAGAYVALQVGRNAIGMFLLRRDEPLRSTFARLVAWSTASGTLWIAGGLADTATRPALWLAALAVDLAGPLLRYVTPGLGRSLTSDWTIDGKHFAERFQLFIIIALGESIVVTGASASQTSLDTVTVVALSVAFLETAALWWLYFDEVAGKSQSGIASHADPGRIARDAYTYLHIPIVAGIILTAVADEILIVDPGHRLSLAGVTVMLGGPLLYLLGEAMFRWRMIRKISIKRLTAIGALALLAVPAIISSAIVLAGGVATVLIGLAIWEYNPGGLGRSAQHHPS
jgi:low temperature requirement protein LtrA